MTAVQPDAGTTSDPLGPGMTEVGALPRRKGTSRARAVVAAYVTLTKPRVIELLLITTLPSMVLAERGFPPLGLVLATLGGGALAAGSAHAINQVVERDIDAVMGRTKRRPLATHAVSPAAALVYAGVLLALSVAIMLVWVNPLAAGLTVLANVFYVVVYTMLLKRRTSQNIVWGGAAGCMPTLIGWAAVTNSLTWTPVLLFLVVFFWTPPHYWPLAMKFREDYARANVPMLPVVADDVEVGRQIVAYTAATVATSLVLWPVAELGWVYAVVAAVAGAWFLSSTLRLWRRARQEAAAAARGVSAASTLQPIRVFRDSITYLTVVFLALAVDIIVFG